MSARRHGLLGLAALSFLVPLGLEAQHEDRPPWLTGLAGPHDPMARSATGLAGRALGPIASVMASIQWVRFQSAMFEGETARAYAIAEQALALDGRSSRGWITLGQHLIFERGSFLENEDLADRRRWIQQGLKVLREGEEVAREPGELAFFAGTVRFVFLAGLPEEDLRWPGGPEALRAAGLADLRRAAAAGSRDAIETLAAIAARASERGPSPARGTDDGR